MDRPAVTIIDGSHQICCDATPLWPAVKPTFRGRGIHDVMVTYDHDASGNVTSEKWFGGDGALVSTAGACLSDTTEHQLSGGFASASARASCSPPLAPCRISWETRRPSRVAALLSGGLHLPMAGTAFLSITRAVIAYVVLLNLMRGLLFGWFYLRQGLIAAMAAHFSADLVLHAIGPLLS